MNHPPGQYEFALAELAAGRLENAELTLRRLLQGAKHDAQLLLTLGQVHRQQGRPTDAIPLYQEVLRQKPDQPDAQYQLAMTLKELGRFDLAEQQFLKLLGLLPDHIDGLTGLGAMLAEQSQIEAALHWLVRAVEARPDFAQARLNLAVCLHLLGRSDEARVELEAALRSRPHYPEAWYNLGNILNVLGRKYDAVVVLQQAVRLRPRYTAAINALVVSLFKQGRFDEAESCLHDALRDQPNLASLHADLGTIKQMTGCLPEAIACFDMALFLDPQCVVALYNRGTTLLSQGKWSQGWPGYEYRWCLPGAIIRPHDQPAWNGTSLKDKTILIWTEQGLGDMIQFARYITVLKAQGARVVFECPPHMVALFRDVEGIDQVITEGDQIPFYDVHAPLLSLPRQLGTTLDNVPATVPYLRANDDLVVRWKKRLAPYDGFKIAISWQGSRDYKADEQRSIALKHFETIARIPGVRLFSIQKNDGAEQMAQVGSRVPVIELGAFDTDGNAFLDSAAIIANMDLVICSDSAPAHLAGALGVPVWVTLPLRPDWRWLLEREDSPWYPTMRLFRQSAQGEWEKVFYRIASELTRLLPST